MAIALLKPVRGRQPLPFGAIHSPRSRSKTAPRSGELGCKRSGNAQAAAVSSSDIMPRPPYRFFFVAEQTLSLAKEVGYSAYFSAGLRAPGYPRNAFFITRSPLRPEQHLRQVTFRTRPAAGVVGKIISGEERMLLVGSCSHPTAWGYHRPAPGPDP